MLGARGNPVLKARRYFGDPFSQANISNVDSKNVIPDREGQTPTSLSWSGASLNSLVQDYIAGHDTGGSIHRARCMGRTIYCVLTQGETRCQMRTGRRREVRGLCQKVEDEQFGGIHCGTRNPHKQTSQTGDPWIVVSHLKERKWTNLSLSNGHTRHGSIIGKQLSDVK